MFTRDKAALAVTVVGTTVMLTAGTAAAAQAGGSPSGTLQACHGEPVAGGAYSPRSVWLGSIFLELRYNPNHQRAWGRISGARPGDGLTAHVKFYDPDNDYQVVDTRRLPFGGGTYTSWADDSFPLVMRACALAPDGVYGWTGWW